MDKMVMELPVRPAYQAITTTSPPKTSPINGAAVECQLSYDTRCFVEVAPCELDVSPDKIPPCAHEPVSLATSGCLTQAYERALRNRIKHRDILPGGCFDAGTDLPVFLHDCLMLPGSLAAKMNLTSEDVLDRMTPGILPGFHANIDSETHQPCLTDSRILGDKVHGMLLFGGSTDCYDVCQQHYGAETKRIKARVELDLATTTPEGLKLGRRAIWAYVWLWREPWGTSFVPRSTCPEGWSIEKYVSATLVLDVYNSIKRSDRGSGARDYDGDCSVDGSGEGGVEARGRVCLWHNKLDGRQGD